MKRPHQQSNETIIGVLMTTEKTNAEKYDDIFITTFMVEHSDLADLKYQDVVAWDSVGHMSMVAELEEVFDIEMDIDDIINLTDYQAGKKTISKYGVVL
jgi:acyl carrier protein